MSRNAPTPGQIRSCIEHLQLPPELERQITNICLRVQTNQLSALFDLIDQQGQHGAQRPDAWRDLLATVMGRLLISGQHAAALYETYRNASLHGQILGRGWHIGPHLITKRGEHYVLHEDVHRHT